MQGRNLTVETKADDFTVANDKAVYLCNAASSPVTVTLLSVTSKDVKNRTYHIKKVDSSNNRCTIDAHLSQTIDGGLTAVLENEDESILLISDGKSDWSIH